MVGLSGREGGGGACSAASAETRVQVTTVKEDLSTGALEYYAATGLLAEIRGKNEMSRFDSFTTLLRLYLVLLPVENVHVSSLVLRL